VAFEIARIADLQRGGLRPRAARGALGRRRGRAGGQINALGYGLTLGVQTRIDSRAQRIADTARVGNVYVNRNMIGAVVGVQPFGGEGLSAPAPRPAGRTTCTASAPSRR
jgi:RHH-type proline utilization regulon transcriptional repressor/proline dehydrogenase/delta 1-pyrroline-5-carboxylate dehydrogenase